MQFPHQFNSNQFNYWKLQRKKKYTPLLLKPERRRKAAHGSTRISGGNSLTLHGRERQWPKIKANSNIPMTTAIRLRWNHAPPRMASFALSHQRKPVNNSSTGELFMHVERKLGEESHSFLAMALNQNCSVSSH